ncbi:hypothetical protein EK21DRAFT_93749 [Setomelanomma holmii]|uniref:Uncharacterized protein n=1 Tax=Setomelanomma holmii TaxID=210430 RepID=A0A9P4GXR2_9PLEO|nr:hypothetical protein EK21DRAFT_93749 [Setomelanomma holmii]
MTLRCLSRHRQGPQASRSLLIAAAIADSPQRTHSRWLVRVHTSKVLQQARSTRLERAQNGSLWPNAKRIVQQRLTASLGNESAASTLARRHTSLGLHGPRARIPEPHARCRWRILTHQPEAAHIRPPRVQQRLLALQAGNEGHTQAKARSRGRTGADVVQSHRWHGQRTCGLDVDRRTHCVPLRHRRRWARILHHPLPEDRMNSLPAGDGIQDGSQGCRCLLIIPHAEGLDVRRNSFDSNIIRVQPDRDSANLAFPPASTEPSDSSSASDLDGTITTPKPDTTVGISRDAFSRE